jgi:hypothetical protein
MPEIGDVKFSSIDCAKTAYLQMRNQVSFWDQNQKLKLGYPGTPIRNCPGTFLFALTA